ncbi:hypothetical protein WD376_003849 [Vibrio vulnificus]|nr:hypothetical protein [Vibrio vulnificus]ELP6740939.1 hypothetical protein [Vibrio vulnificus]ELU4007822.1 hypothetical protein [Vibrio vulnificus]HAS8511884.1 hypothetical protein [Vibrio vulnificus]HAS8515706.1 hypothetical protein [Vibrio vulnificus]
MNRIIMTALTAITALFTLMFSLLLAIPLTIVALITGKRIEKQLKQAQAQRTQHDDGQQHRVIDGEFEEVSR